LEIIIPAAQSNTDLNATSKLIWSHTAERFCRDTCSIIQWITRRTAKTNQFPWHDADYAGSVSENSRCVRYLSMMYLLKTVFFHFSAAVRTKRTLVSKITENVSEHSLSRDHNCVSHEACPPSTLGSHAPFPMTLLYSRESIWFSLDLVNVLSSKTILRMYNSLLCSMSKS